MRIEKIKKTGSKYKIILEDGTVITTYEEIIFNKGLLYHKDLNEKTVKEIESDSDYYEGYHKVLDMISRRLRSELGIRKYLEKRDFSNNDINKIIEELKRIDLINDERYAKAYTNDKINLSLDGPYKIKKHLESEGINEEYINIAINSIPKDIMYAHIDKIIERKVKNNTKYTAYALKQKILTYLINLGYDKSDVFTRLENFKIENKSSEKQLDKFYEKLSKKYEGNILYHKFKAKAFSKGYEVGEIDEYLNKKTVL